jgi:hypothetical protein
MEIRNYLAYVAFLVQLIINLEVKELDSFSFLYRVITVVYIHIC